MPIRLHRPNRSELTTGAVTAAIGATAGFIAARTSRKSPPAADVTPDDAAWHLALRSMHPPRR